MKTFTNLAVVVFVVIALLHLLRVAFGWEAVIAGVQVPVWASVVFAVIVGVLAWMLVKENKLKF